MTDWQSKVRVELKTGQNAQEMGNEGMARVCARRAAVWVANAFFEQEGIASDAKSGLEKLEYLLESEFVGEETKKRLEKLTRSVEQDSLQGESFWPQEVNLLEEAENLANDLLPDYSKK